MPVTYREIPGVGLEWISPTPGFMRRASHALAVDGRVWLTDPVDAPDLDARLAGLGTPAGVVQLLDRHGRDGAAIARRLGVPLVRADAGEPGGTPFRWIRISDRLWREAALWWPEGRVLVTGDALGTAPYFRAPGRRLGVHPTLRLTPPRALAGLDAHHVLTGHGEGLSGPEAAADLRRAVTGARAEIGLWAAALLYPPRWSSRR